MTVGPSDFEDFADRVQNTFSDEIDRRNAIRARYYHIFHLIRENGDSEPEVTFQQDAGDHGRVKDLLDAKGEPGLEQDIAKLHRARRHADYDLDKTVSDADLTHKSTIHHRLKTGLMALSWVS